MENRTHSLEVLDQAESMVTADLDAIAVALRIRQRAIDGLTPPLEPSREWLARLSQSVAWGEVVRSKLAVMRESALSDWREGEQRRRLLRDLGATSPDEPAWIDRHG